MKIEFLFPELCNLYGDATNIRYLKQTLPDAEVLRTPLAETPAFLQGDVDLVYMGAMTERSQELVIQRLLPYAQVMESQIQSGRVFLMTGNAMEVFCAAIENEDGSRINGLGLFPLTARRQMFRRYNSLYLGKFQDIDIVGFKNQFSHLYGENRDGHLFDTQRGCSLNPQTMAEGLRRKNFLGTYLLGPMLVLNPKFTQYLLSLLGSDAVPAFYEAAMDAYNQRLGEFLDPKTEY